MQQDCERAKSLILSKILSSISDQDNQFLRNHLEACDSCKQAFLNRLRQQGFSLEKHENPIGYFFQEQTEGEQIEDSAVSSSPSKKEPKTVMYSGESGETPEEEMGTIPDKLRERWISTHPTAWASLLFVLGMLIYLWPLIPSLNGFRISSYPAGKTTPPLSEALPFSPSLSLASNFPETVSPPYLLQPTIRLRRSGNTSRDNPQTITLRIEDEQGEVHQRKEVTIRGNEDWKPLINLDGNEPGTYHANIQIGNRLSTSETFRLQEEKPPVPDVQFNPTLPFHPLTIKQKKSARRSPSNRPFAEMLLQAEQNNSWMFLHTLPTKSIRRNTPRTKQEIYTALLPKMEFAMDWTSATGAPGKGVKFTSSGQPNSFFWTRFPSYKPGDNQLLLKGRIVDDMGNPVSNASYQLRINRIKRNDSVIFSPSDPSADSTDHSALFSPSRGTFSEEGLFALQVTLPRRIIPDHRVRVEGLITISHPDYPSYQRPFSLPIKSNINRRPGSSNVYQSYSRDRTLRVRLQQHREHHFQGTINAVTQKTKTVTPDIKSDQSEDSTSNDQFNNDDRTYVDDRSRNTASSEGPIQLTLVKDDTIRQQKKLKLQDEGTFSFEASNLLSPPYWCVLSPSPYKNIRKQTAIRVVAHQQHQYSAILDTKTASSKPVVEKQSPKQITILGGTPEWTGPGSTLQGIWRWIARGLIVLSLILLLIHAIWNPITALGILTGILTFVLGLEMFAGRVWQYFGGLEIATNWPFQLPALIGLTTVSPSAISFPVLISFAGLLAIVTLFTAYVHEAQKRYTRLLPVMMMWGLIVSPYFYEPFQTWPWRYLELGLQGTVIAGAGLLFAQGWFSRVRFAGISVEGISFFTVCFVVLAHALISHSSQFQQSFVTLSEKQVTFEPPEISSKNITFRRYRTQHQRRYPLQYMTRTNEQPGSREIQSHRYSNEDLPSIDPMRAREESTLFLLLDLLHQVQPPNDPRSISGLQRDELYLVLGHRQLAEGGFPLFPRKDTYDLISTGLIGLFALQKQTLQFSKQQQSRLRTFLKQQLNQNHSVQLDSFWLTIWPREESVFLGETLAKWAIGRIDSDLARNILEKRLNLNRIQANVTDRRIPSIPLYYVLSQFISGQQSTTSKKQGPLRIEKNARVAPSTSVALLQKKIRKNNNQNWTLDLKLHNQSIGSRRPRTIEIQLDEPTKFDREILNTLRNHENIHEVIPGKYSLHIITKQFAPGEKLQLSVPLRSRSPDTNKPTYSVNLRPAISSKSY